MRKRIKSFRSDNDTFILIAKSNLQIEESIWN